MPDHSVVFDRTDPHCPVCGHEDVDVQETDRYEEVWTCPECARWSHSRGYKKETPL